MNIWGCLQCVIELRALRSSAGLAMESQRKAIQIDVDGNSNPSKTRKSQRMQLGESAA
jgi:hypothetical protein